MPGEGPLGAWIMRQRSQGRGRMQPPLSAEHVAALDRTPGWSWGEFKIEPWESRCQQLQTFVRQHGRLPRYTAGKSSPFLHAEKGLGNWVRNQRQQYKARKLSAEQIAALEATPGWCWAEWSQQAWESRLQQVHSFVLEHGRLPRQQGSKGMPLQPREKALGSWCNQQRQRWKGKTQPAAADGRAAGRSSHCSWLVWGRGRLVGAAVGAAAAAAEGLCAAAQAHATRAGHAEGAAAGGRAGAGTLAAAAAAERHGRGPPLTAKQVAALEAIPLWGSKEGLPNAGML